VHSSPTLCPVPTTHPPPPSRPQKGVSGINTVVENRAAAAAAAAAEWALDADAATSEIDLSRLSGGGSGGAEVEEEGGWTGTEGVYLRLGWTAALGVDRPRSLTLASFTMALQEGRTRIGAIYSVGSDIVPSLWSLLDVS
jgi:hypothetical protein